MNQRFQKLMIAMFAMIPLHTYAQNKPGTELRVSKAIADIVLDGQLNEASWQTAEVAGDFFLNYPVDTLAPSYQSEVKVTFNDHFLYFGIVCYDDDKKDIVQSLRRDFEWELNDNVGIYFDPFNDFTNGFYFTITPMGVQSEGIMINGGATDESFNNTWDNKWYSKVQRLKDRWVAEIAIPFKSIRYSPDSWNMTFLRNDVKRNQISSWIATPIQYIPASLSYAGKIIWQDALPEHSTNISVIPYVAGSVSRDKENDKPTESDISAGFDAKIGLTSSMNLDLTVNPDFSNVEVDRQVVNLTRFEFSFPERRQFFLENSDLFAAPGYPDSRPFFSRRIGLAKDTSGNIQRIPILYGARISGKVGKDWRIGLMNMHTREQEELGLPDQNYTVAVVQRQIFSRSNIGFVFVNKQSLGLDNYDSSKLYHESVIYKPQGQTSYTFKRYNRVYGVDFNLFSKSNKWTGDFYYHRSADANVEDKNYSYGAYLGYNKREFQVQAGMQGLGKNFNAETGFVPGLNVYPGYYSGFAAAQYRFYPTKKRVAVMGPGIEYSLAALPDGQITDQSVEIGWDWNFLNTSRLEIGALATFQRLPEDFNPIDPKGDSTLLAGEQFRWYTIGIEYQSDSRKVFNFSLESSYGGFYNGTLLNINGILNYRYQPYGSLAVQFDYNDIQLPQEYGSAQFILIGPRLDLTFTDKLFLTTFVQYNDRVDNVNLNARFQWRFKPASDFFVVYTENYVAGSGTSKNSALVLKLTYWFNL
jgi:hypothetical protein